MCDTYKSNLYIVEHKSMVINAAPHTCLSSCSHRFLVTLCHLGASWAPQPCVCLNSHSCNKTSWVSNCANVNFAPQTCPTLLAPVLLCEGVSLFTHGLQVLGVIVVGGAQMDAVAALCRLQGLLPLSRGLVEVVEQVVALTALVQLLCIFLLEDRKRDREADAFGFWKVPRSLCEGWCSNTQEVV